MTASGRIGKCLKCGKKDIPLTTHHVLPVRIYGKKNSGLRMDLCLDCHIKIENYIRRMENKYIERNPAFYMKINAQWVIGGE